MYSTHAMDIAPSLPSSGEGKERNPLQQEEGKVRDPLGKERF